VKRIKMQSLSTEPTIRSLIFALAETEFEWVYVSEEYRVEALLKQYNFDLVVLDSSIEELGMTCRYIRDIGTAPIVLIVEQEQPDWREIHSLDVDSYIQGVSGTELVARLRAALRRFQYSEQPGRINSRPEHPKIFIQS